MIEQVRTNNCQAPLVKVNGHEVCAKCLKGTLDRVHEIRQVETTVICTWYTYRPMEPDEWTEIVEIMTP